MDTWESSPFQKMSGAEFEIQEALVALQRLLQNGAVRATTRAILEGAILTLRSELEGGDQSESPRRAAPK